ncbi:MAG TPA: PD-(D/E)XK nuclease family protein [Thermoanaerobaculia bacterium]|nr:PD-(D/E)XK nuclease family protein [Thermoanaerobaculia bacterium]
MRSHRVLAGPFPALEPLLFDALDEARSGDPLARVEVLVGSNLVGVYLRRRYAEERGAHANVRFLTFLDLARAIAPDDPRPPLPPLGALLLARRALLQTPEAGSFGALRSRTSLASALLSTADELRDESVPPQEVARALDGLEASPDRRPFLDALAASVHALEAGRARFQDAASVLERSASGGDAGPGPRLFVYGVYDVRGVKAALLARLADARAVTAFVPATDAGDPHARDIESLLGASATRVAGPPACEFLPVLAPSDGAEACEVVREVLRASEAGIPLHRMAVLVRDPSRQEPALVAELKRRGIPFFRPGGTGVFSRSAAGRAARLLLELAAFDLPAARLVELFDVLETLGIGVTAHETARAVRELRVVSGKDALLAALERARARAGDGSDETEADRDSSWARRRRRARTALASFTRAFALVERAVPSAEPAGWRAWGERLSRAFAALLPRHPELPRLVEAADALAELDTVDAAPVAAAEVLEALPDALDLSPAPAARFERDGLSLLSLVSARGLLFDAVFVPGLVERLLPAPSRPDPLLFDSEREALSRATGRRLEPRGGPRHAREERFLFELARSSARKRLVLLAARRDVVNDRARLLSPYLVSLLEEREGARGGTQRALGESDLLDANVAERLQLRRPHLGEVCRDEPPTGADEVLARALQADPRAAATVETLSEPLRRAMRRARGRYGSAFSVYEGLLPRGTERYEIGGRATSPSRLERFARCPHEAFLEDVLRLVPREEEDEDLSPETLVVGNIAHAVLRDLARDAAERGIALGRLPAKHAEFRARTLAAEAVATWSEGPRTAPERVRDAARVEIEALVASVLEYERRRPAPLPVAGAEVRFGASPLPPEDRDDDPELSSDEPVPLEGGGATFRFTGKIDRVDRDGARALVVDYKFGKAAPYGKTNQEGHVLAGGQRLQLPVYARAAERLGATEVAAEYVFLPRARGRRVGEPVVFALDPLGTAAAVEELARFAALAREAAATGRFLPFVDGARWPHPCETCGVAAVCGPGHEALFEKKWEREKERRGHARALLEMREIR